MAAGLSPWPPVQEVSALPGQNVTLLPCRFFPHSLWALTSPPEDRVLEPASDLCPRQSLGLLTALEDSSVTPHSPCLSSLLTPVLILVSFSSSLAYLFLKKYVFIFLIKNFFWCVCRGIYMLQCICRGEQTISRSQFPPSTPWVPGIELRL